MGEVVLNERDRIMKEIDKTETE